MTRGGKVLSVMLVVLLGLWGCARGPVGQTAQNERIHFLESECSKLKNDYRAVASARDQFQKQVDKLETERKRLQKDLSDKQVVLKERDTLKQQVLTCTSERDNLQLRCDRMKKGLQSLLGQDDALLPTSPAPTASSNGPALTVPTQS